MKALILRVKRIWVTVESKLIIIGVFGLGLVTFILLIKGDDNNAILMAAAVVIIVGLSYVPTLLRKFIEMGKKGGEKR